MQMCNYIFVQTDMYQLNSKKSLCDVVNVDAATRDAGDSTDEVIPHAVSD